MKTNVRLLQPKRVESSAKVCCIQHTMRDRCRAIEDRTSGSIVEEKQRLARSRVNQQESGASSNRYHSRHHRDSSEDGPIRQAALPDERTRGRVKCAQAALAVCTLHCRVAPGHVELRAIPGAG